MAFLCKLVNATAHTKPCTKAFACICGVYHYNNAFIAVGQSIENPLHGQSIINSPYVHKIRKKFTMGYMFKHLIRTDTVKYGNTLSLEPQYPLISISKCKLP